jgi:hypothetical protein
VTSRLRRLPSPALMIAGVALFLSLGGGAYALQGRNTVDSGDIQKGAVGKSETAARSVGSSEIRGGSIQPGDLGDYSYVNQANFTVPANLPASGSVNCDNGDTAAGGGFNTGAPAPDQQNVEASYPSGLPSDDPPGWTVVLYNRTASPITNTVYVVCNDGGS